MDRLDRFKRELDEAIKRGVHVDDFVIDEELKLEKFRVQAFGMRCAIIFSFAAPLVIYAVLCIAAAYKLDINLHEEYALYVCFGNLVSIIAFGFNGPPVIRLPKKKD
jgi:hypothetical protein